jgi:hypothetical protein
MSLPPDDRPRLIDVVDRLLDQGVILRGDLWLTVADVELVYVGAKLILATPEKAAALRLAVPPA